MCTSNVYTFFSSRFCGWFFQAFSIWDSNFCTAAVQRVSIQPRTSPIKFARSADHAAVRSACRRCTPATRPQARRAPRRGLKAAPRSSPRSSTASGDETSERRQRASVGKISAKCCSFSAVSAPIFATKYAFCSMFQNLSDFQAEIFEIWQYFANFAKFLLNFHENC